MFVNSIIPILSGLVKRRDVLVLLAVVFIALAFLAMLYWRIDARAQVDAAQRADAIIVLGSAVYPGGRPSPSLAGRTRHAIDLYKAGYAQALILCGGVGNLPPSEAQVMQQMAIASGVPASALILEDQSHSTEENLSNSKRLMDARGWHSAIIVSDPYHLFRAEIIARDIGIEAHGSGAMLSQTRGAAQRRIGYTAREAIALIWYYAGRVVGEPAWLYTLLKGKI